MGRTQKYLKSKEEKARRKQQWKKMRVTVQENLVVGYWELVPMVSGSDNSSEQNTATVTKELEEPAEKQMMILWRKEENWPTLRKDMEILRNPAFNRGCDEYPVTQMKVTNCLQRIDSKPITFDNAFPTGKQELL